MHSEYTGGERRKCKRARVSLTVVYRVNGPLSVSMLTADREIEATIIDLSESGMAVLTNYAIPESTVLLMRFTLLKIDNKDISSYGPMELTGEVRYNTLVGKDAYRLGICFTEIQEEYQHKIAEFVKMIGNKEH